MQSLQLLTVYCLVIATPNTSIVRESFVSQFKTPLKTIFVNHRAGAGADTDPADPQNILVLSN